MLYGGSGRSFAQKAVLMFAQSLLLLTAFWLLFFGGLEWMSRVTNRDWARAASSRRTVLAICFGIVYLRMAVTMFYPLKRAMGWEEALTIPTASEVLRDRWKMDQANKGKLYTGGLFRYSMHVMRYESHGPFPATV
jgi:hypothetical protein